MRTPAQHALRVDTAACHSAGRRGAAGPIGVSAMLTPQGVLRMQRAAGNRAVRRVLMRMTAEAAALAAKGDGCTDSDVDTRTAAGERYDFVAKAWVTPDDESLWDKWYAGMKRAPEPRRVTFLTWAEGKKPDPNVALKAVAAKIPIDIDDDTQLKSLWGPSAKFDRDDRVKFLRSLFEIAGHKIKDQYDARRSGAAFKPVILEIDHPLITMIEIHPGGGSQHKGSYLRFSTLRGMVKVINRSILPAYEEKGEKVLKYVDVAMPELTAPPQPSTVPLAVTSPPPSTSPVPAVAPSLQGGSATSLKEEED